MPGPDACIETAGVRRWDEARRAACATRYARALAAYSGPARRASCTTAEFTAAHLAIHLAFVGLTGSARLVAVADALHAEVRLALATVDRSRRNAAEQVHSHGDLVGLMEEGRIEDAAAGLAHHLEGAERVDARARSGVDV